MDRGHRIHRRASVGVIIGAPLFWHWPPPYYTLPPAGYYAFPPPVVAVPGPPPVYIERGYQPAPSEPGFWYYCHDPAGYYPYVKECPGGWEQVAPTPSR